MKGQFQMINFYLRTTKHDNKIFYDIPIRYFFMEDRPTTFLPPTHYSEGAIFMYFPRYTISHILFLCEAFTFLQLFNDIFRRINFDWKSVFKFIFPIEFLSPSKA